MLVKFVKPNAGILNIPKEMTDLVKPEGMSDEEYAKRQANRTPEVYSIVPGMNDIPNKTWNRIKNNDTVKKYIARKHLVLVNGETTKNEKTGKEIDVESKPYKDMTVKEQEAVIAETEQIKLLKSLKKQTKDGAIAALNDKLDRMEHPEKYVDDENEED